MPTAEEFYKYHNSNNYRDFDKTIFTGKQLKQAMIEFAKLHVKAALEAVDINRRNHYLGDPKHYTEFSKESILSAYPETNII